MNCELKILDSFLFYEIIDMIQENPIYKHLKLAGPSGQTNPARSMFRCSRCFAVVNELVWSIFGVPQGMSLAGAINVSTWSMFRCSRYVNYNFLCFNTLVRCNIYMLLILQTERRIIWLKTNLYKINGIWTDKREASQLVDLRAAAEVKIVLGIKIN